MDGAAWVMACDGSASHRRQCARRRLCSQREGKAAAEATAHLAASIHTPVIASGGIRDLDDINRLLEVTDSGIFAAITGRAIYEGTLNFGEANKLAAARAAPY